MLVRACTPRNWHDLFSMISRTVLALFLALPLLSHPAFADVTTIGWWRLGEDDPGALDAAQAQNPTVATTGPFPLSWDSATDGNAFYRSDTAPAKRLRLGASTLAIEIDDTPAYPGYHTATLPSTATTNISLEIWAKAIEAVVDGGNPSDIIIWNGETPGSGYGIIQQNNVWGAAIRLIGTGDFTMVATAPLTTGVWTHLALIESGGTWNFYVNGKVAGTLASNARSPEFRFSIGESFNALDQVSTASSTKPGFSPSPPGPFRRRI